MNEELAEIVKHQAEMVTLWYVNPTITEHILQMALRHLHAVIENNPEMAKRAKAQYWELESEM